MLVHIVNRPDLDKLSSTLVLRYNRIIYVTSMFYVKKVLKSDKTTKKQ